MEPNPYESPKEVPTIKAGMALGVLLLLTIPAGCICGGVTFWTSFTVLDIVDILVTPIGFGFRFSISIPIGLVVAVLIPVLAFLISRKRTSAIHGALPNSSALAPNPPKN